MNAPPPLDSFFLAERLAADDYDALTTERPYKRTFPHDEADANLRDQSGAVLDPRVVETFGALPFHALAEAAA